MADEPPSFPLWQLHAHNSASGGVPEVGKVKLSPCRRCAMARPFVTFQLRDSRGQSMHRVGQIGDRLQC